MHHWHPSSWQRKADAQAIPYPSAVDVDAITSRLNHYAPLISHEEIIQLKQHIALAAQEHQFVLQAGACAERFSDCSPQRVHRSLVLLEQMSTLLRQGLGQPIVCIGRLAGQYAKPRSSAYEIADGTRLLSYRGDAINRPELTTAARTPRAVRLLMAYHHSAATLSYIKQSLSTPEQLLQHCYTSHEALSLHYEQALTHQHSTGNWYNYATHMPWLGVRTGDLDGAHVEYLRGIHNPIAIKVGPATDTNWLSELVQTLNPHNEAGRITLITRLGKHKVAQCLPPLIECIQQQKRQVLWMCDPMHGNTTLTPQGIKTRYVSDIMDELTASFTIHQRYNSYLGGLHLEVSPATISECLDDRLSGDLAHRYQSLVDPQLNANQAMTLIKLGINSHDALATNNHSHAISY